ncbi:MAG: hypothetical protein IKD69_12190 [Solobacterium sp.]|nr:hypothetical protein [Solobacterium sp.]
MEEFIETFVANHPAFTTDEFVNMMQEERPAIGRSTIYQIIKKKCDEGIITRTSRGHYTSTVKKKYNYSLSETAKSISIQIQQKYPLVDFQVWELFQMNEFVNHLFAKNTVFVEVENALDESVFILLFSQYPHVLFHPDMNEYCKYAGDETIIVRKLYTETPPAFGKYRQASLEKILVDLFGRGLSGSMISRSEYKSIYEDAFNKYKTNQARLFRYARRRGIESDIRAWISEMTNIILEENT